MTDLHAGYIVVLENNIREDDAAQTIAALKQIKGVLDVCTIVADPMLTVAEARVRIKFLTMLQKVFEQGTG